MIFLWLSLDWKLVVKLVIVEIFNILSFEWVVIIIFGIVDIFIVCVFIVWNVWIFVGVL